MPGKGQKHDGFWVNPTKDTPDPDPAAQTEEGKGKRKMGPEVK